MNQQSQPVQRYPIEQDDGLDLIELLKVLVVYKRLIIILTALSTLGAIYYASTLPTVYKTEVLMLPSSSPSSASDNFKFSSMARVAGISMDISAGVEGEQALARLNTKSFLINHIKEKNLKPVLFANQWNQSENTWTNEEPSDLKASELLLDMITVSIDPKDKARLVVFSLEWENPSDPSKIADMANDLISSINFNAKQLAIVEAKNSISFLEKELEQTSVVNSQAILYSMIEQQMQKIMFANIRDEFVFKVIDPSVIPSNPEPKRILTVILLGFILGLFSGSLISIFINYVNKKKDEISHSL